MLGVIDVIRLYFLPDGTVIKSDKRISLGDLPLGTIAYRPENAITCQWAISVTLDYNQWDDMPDDRVPAEIKMKALLLT